MPRHKKFKAADIAAAIVEHRGDLVDAADAVGCTVRTIYNYRDTDAIVAEAMDETKKRTHNHVRNKLMELIDAGNVTAIIFWLKTQGKGEGWVERTEFSGVDGGAIAIRDETIKELSDDDLRRNIETLGKAAALLAASGRDESQHDTGNV